MITPRSIMNELSYEEKEVWLNFYHISQELHNTQNIDMQCTAAEGALRQALNLIEETYILRTNPVIETNKEHIRLTRREIRRTRENINIRTRRANNARAAAYEIFNNQEMLILEQAQKLIDETKIS